MDFEILLYVILFIVYIVYQLRAATRSRNPERPRAPQPTSQRPPSQPGDEFETALQDIRRALGLEEAPAQEHEPVPQETTLQPAPPSPSPPHEQSAPVGPRRTYAEEAFTREDRFEIEAVPGVSVADGLENLRVASEKSLVQPLLAPLSIHPSAGSPAQPQRSDLLQHLRDPKAARQAVLLSEILGPPRAHRRR